MKITLVFALFLLTACGNSDSNEAKTSALKQGEITVVAGDESSGNSLSPFVAYSITGEHKVKYSLDGEETPLTKEIGAHVVIKNHPFESIEKSLLMKKLSKNFIVKCSACHDDYGNGVIGPSLLTKSEDEVFDMIIKYKTDKASNILMRELVSKMDEKEVRFIAADIAKFNEEIRTGGKK